MKRSRFTEDQIIGILKEHGDGSGIVAAKAVAVIGPIPGMVASKRQIELVLWISAIRMSIPSIC